MYVWSSNLSTTYLMTLAMTILGLHLVDFLMIFVYLIGITWLGVWSSKLIKGSSDFFMPRHFSWKMLITYSFGTGTHSDQAVSIASKTYTNGLSGIWYQWLWLFATPFYWLIAPIMRRFRAITTADVFALRYNKSIAVLYAIVGMAMMTVTIGMMLKGASEVVTAVFGGAVSADAAILIMTAMFVLYGVAGGLNAAIITDFIQGILTLVFSFLLLPFIMDAVGGFSGLHEKITDPELFSLIAPSDINTFYIVVIALNALIGVVVQPHTMSNCAAGRNELDGRIGFTVGTYLKRICTMAWTLTGFAAIAYFAGHAAIDPDEIFGMTAREFLPEVFPGLLGIFLASLLASVMSSCDAFMVVSSALFTENIYKNVETNRSDKHYLNAGRIASLVVVAAGVIFAFEVKSVIDALEYFWIVASLMGIAFWLGYFWKRMNVAGAWASTIVSILVWLLTEQGFFAQWLSTLPLNDTWRLTTTGSGGALSVYLPWQMVLYLSTGLLAGIIASLATKPVNKEKTDLYYALIRTPIGKDEKLNKSCTLPANAQVPNERLLIPKWKNLYLQRPDKMSIMGFVLAWVGVILLIYLFKWIIS